VAVVSADWGQKLSRDCAEAIAALRSDCHVCVNSDFVT